jgi:hypothetical protein
MYCVKYCPKDVIINEGKYYINSKKKPSQYDIVLLKNGLYEISNLKTSVDDLIKVNLTPYHSMDLHTDICFVKKNDTSIMYKYNDRGCFYQVNLNTIMDKIHKLSESLSVESFVTTI